MSIVNDALKKAAGQRIEKILIEPSMPLRQQPARKGVIVVLGGIVILIVLIGLFLLKQPLLLEQGRRGNIALPYLGSQDENVGGIAKGEFIEKISGGETRDKLDEEAEKKLVKEITGKEELAKKPKLSLTGIVWGNERPYAFINNMMVEEGEMIDGAKVVKIDYRKVLLSFGEKEIFLSLGK